MLIGFIKTAQEHYYFLHVFFLLNFFSTNDLKKKKHLNALICFRLETAYFLTLHIFLFLSEGVLSS